MFRQLSKLIINRAVFCLLKIRRDAFLSPPVLSFGWLTFLCISSFSFASPLERESFFDSQKEYQKVSWRLMQDFQFPSLASLQLDFNSLNPYERVLMAHLLSMHALILSMQALESEGKLLPHSYRPQANNQYLSLERELNHCPKNTAKAQLIHQDITVLTKLYAELSTNSKANINKSLKNK